MIVLDGQPALSAFRIDRLNAELAHHAPGCRVRAARYVYFVDAERSRIDLERLCEVVEGTPTVLAPDGTKIGGYLSPAEMEAKLQNLGKASFAGG